MKPSLVIGERADGSFEVLQIGNDPEASRQALAKSEQDPSFVEVALFQKPVAYRRRYPIRVLKEQAIAKAEAKANAAAKPSAPTISPELELAPLSVAVSNDTATVPALDLPDPAPRSDAPAGFFAEQAPAEHEDPDPDSGETIKPSKPAAAKGAKSPKKANS
jgi:hypothetical protein